MKANNWMILLTVLLSLFFSLKAFSDTHVAGAVSGVWTFVGSPYYVDWVEVQSGDTLIIQPGVEVLAPLGGQSFYIAGVVIAVGTESQPILFSSDQANPQVNDGLCLQVYSDGQCQFKWCIMEYGDGNPMTIQSSTIVENCIFRQLICKYCKRYSRN